MQSALSSQASPVTVHDLGPNGDREESSANQINCSTSSKINSESLESSPNSFNFAVLPPELQTVNVPINPINPVFDFNHFNVPGVSEQNKPGSFANAEQSAKPLETTAPAAAPSALPVPATSLMGSPNFSIPWPTFSFSTESLPTESLPRAQPGKRADHDAVKQTKPSISLTSSTSPKKINKSKKKNFRVNDQSGKLEILEIENQYQRDFDTKNAERIMSRFQRMENRYRNRVDDLRNDMNLCMSDLYQQLSTLQKQSELLKRQLAESKNYSTHLENRIHSLEGRQRSQLNKHHESHCTGLQSMPVNITQSTPAVLNSAIAVAPQQQQQQQQDHRRIPFTNLDAPIPETRRNIPYSTVTSHFSPTKQTQTTPHSKIHDCRDLERELAKFFTMFDFF